MMKAVSFYDAADGRLTGGQFSGLAPSIPINTPPGLMALDGFWDATQYRVIEGAAVAREACPITSSTSGLIVTLHAVPFNATVIVNDGGKRTEIVQDDGSGDLEITLPASGTYTITCDCFPAQDYDEVFDV